MIARTTVLLTAALLTACASPPQLTREQWLAETTRTYPGHTPAEILDAAREVFIEADGTDDFSFAYPDEHTMQARRTWFIYAVLAFSSGEDDWTVTALPHGNETLARVNLVALPVVREPQMYRLFWARLDYHLGLRAEWPPCSDYPTIWVGSKEALCGSTIDGRV